jgi:hypothetical protein
VARRSEIYGERSWHAGVDQKPHGSAVTTSGSNRSPATNRCA